MPETFTLSQVIPTTPQRLYEAWLSSEEHSKMTGAAAAYQGDQFTAWDGYIAGKTLEMKPYERIKQTWRTTEFPEGAADSEVVITFAPATEGTTLTIEQTNIPDGQREGYADGWRNFYFAPMAEYFGTPGAKFKEASEALENAVEHAVEQASAQVAKVVGQAKRGAQKQAAKAQKQAVKVVAKAQKGAQKQAAKAQKQAVKAVKSAKKAAKSLGQKVRAALKPKSQVKAKVKAAPKKALKKVAAKAKKAAVAKKKPAAKKKSRR